MIPLRQSAALKGGFKIPLPVFFRRHAIGLLKNLNKVALGSAIDLSDIEVIENKTQSGNDALDDNEEGDEEQPDSSSSSAATAA